VKRLWNVQQQQQQQQQCFALVACVGQYEFVDLCKSYVSGLLAAAAAAAAAAMLCTGFA
jgi:hypothetical protein